MFVIPSYQRYDVLKNKTLHLLQTSNVSMDKVYVFCIEDEYEQYRNLPCHVIIGKKGLIQQRQFIMEYFPNKHLIFLDDDIESIDLCNFESLEYFCNYAFQQCIEHKCTLWGVYPVFNPFFRKTKKPMTTCLNYIVGAFYGVINTKPLLLTMDEKEDVERSILHFIQDGKVLRFNNIGFKTKYYGKTGGLGNFKSRLESAKIACNLLNEKYSKYGKIKVRKNGMTEFVLKSK